MGDVSMTEFWTLLPWMSVTQHWQLKKLLQNLQTDNKYWNQWPTLRSTCFSSRKFSFSSPMENNCSHKQFLVVHLQMSCSLMPLCVLWVSNLLNSLGEMRVRFSDELYDNHYCLSQSCHLLGQCHQGLWITQWGTLIEGSWECFSLFLCNLYYAEKSTHRKQWGRREYYLVQGLPGIAFVTHKMGLAPGQTTPILSSHILSSTFSMDIPELGILAFPFVLACHSNVPDYP